MFRSDRTVIAPDSEALLRAQGLESADAVYRLNTGQVVTRSNTTEVRRVELPAGAAVARTFYIKKYWFSTAAERWRGMFRGTFFGRSKVRREFENLVRLGRWGLDAPSAVAYGEERFAGWLVRSFLISEGVPDALPLHRFVRDVLSGLPSGERRERQRELIERLAEQTRRLHERRFVHGDYFWRNIILSGHSLKHFFLIDAHKGRCWRAWEEQRSRALDLAALDAPAPAYFRRTERLRFFLTYRGHRTLTTHDRSLIQRTLELARPMRDGQLRRVVGKVGSGGKPAFAVEPRDLLMIEPPIREAFDRLGLKTAAAVANFFTQGQPIKAGVFVKQTDLPLPDGSKLPAFYKQYEYALATWRFFGRRSKAHREFESYAAFTRAGVPCAERLAMGEMRDGLGRLLRAFILTRAVPGARTLTEFVQQECPDRRTLASLALRSSLLRQLAVLTRRLHDGGFFHNDLYWRNILVTWDRAAEPRLWWIDCPRGRYALFRRAHHRLKDLACLDKMASRLCTRAERLEFVRQYLGKTAIDVETREWAAAADRYRRRRWRDEGAVEKGARFSPLC